MCRGRRDREKRAPTRFCYIRSKTTGFLFQSAAAQSSSSARVRVCLSNHYLLCSCVGGARWREMTVPFLGQRQQLDTGQLTSDKPSRALR